MGGSEKEREKDEKILRSYFSPCACADEWAVAERLLRGRHGYRRFFFIDCNTRGGLDEKRSSDFRYRVLIETNFETKFRRKRFIRFKRG